VLPITNADEVDNENANIVLSNYCNIRHKQTIIDEEMDPIKEIVEEEKDENKID
jgi:hypothetical protein